MANERTGQKSCQVKSSHKREEGPARRSVAATEHGQNGWITGYHWVFLFLYFPLTLSPRTNPCPTLEQAEPTSTSSYRSASASPRPIALSPFPSHSPFGDRFPSLPVSPVFAIPSHCPDLCRRPFENMQRTIHAPNNQSCRGIASRDNCVQDAAQQRRVNSADPNRCE